MGERTKIPRTLAAGMFLFVPAIETREFLETFIIGGAFVCSSAADVRRERPVLGVKRQILGMRLRVRARPVDCNKNDQ